jgi:hypothetical protein
MIRDIYNNVSTVQSLAPAARTVSVAGASADLREFGGALVQIHAGAWTDGTHTFDVQESDDDVTFTSVAAAQLQGTEPVIDSAAEGGKVYEIGYLGSKPYLRVNVAVATATTGAVYGVSILRGHPHRASTR